MSAPTKTSYGDRIYTALGPDESRLVKLLPGKDSEPIKCMLQHFNILDPPRYEALSYAWGDANITRPITVNGYPLYVTTNLWIALQYLRWTDKPRIIWIDAIVINQEDYRERNEQVKLMSILYSRAALVRVWLGPADHYSDFAMEFFADFRRTHANTIKIARSFNDVFRYLWEWIDTSGQVKQMHSNIPIFAKGHRGKNSGFPFVAVGALFLTQSAWYTRRWCVQEIGLARKTTVQCGTKEVTWEQMRACINTCYDGTTGFWSNLKRAGYLSNPLSNAQVLSDPVCFQKKQLTELLVHFRQWKNGDPRDTVYALLALVKDDCGTPQIAPDYSKPAVNVLIETVEHAIHSSKNLNLIAIPWAPCVEGLPSWIVPAYRFGFHLDAESYTRPLLGMKTQNESSGREYMAVLQGSRSSWEAKARIERPNARELFPTGPKDAYTLVAQGVTLHYFTSFESRPDNPLALKCFAIAEQGAFPERFVGYTSEVSLWEHRRPGDKIVLLSGCIYPMLLRPSRGTASTNNTFTLLALFLYIDGPLAMMEGVDTSNFDSCLETFVLY